MKVNRLRSVVGVLAAVTLSTVLVGCQGSGAGGGAKAGAAVAGSSSGPAAGGAADAHSGATPAAASPAAAAPAAPAAPAASAAPAARAGSVVSGAAVAASPAGGCSDATPSPDDVDPDEFAVYRVEELDGSTGKVNLVIQHGAWGWPGKDTDGAPFVVTGEESRWALDQAAYVTATNPITAGAGNQRIGVQELIDWIDAHPDSGLVFRYETGDDGAIHRLEQVFAP
ncbi:hypothetical protein [Streptomyces sp900129855]|uniref:Lipoprotein n=1 Tax=Streptomyces sp. 900129855 TaxID=3155129 RepID=A0ABV2ZY09_9ACTN